jgi:hypothetical protein
VSIAADPRRVYEFASDPAKLPLWASGFVKSVACRDGRWLAETTIGEVTFEFAPRNAFGVLDHDVTLPDGARFFNPMRVVPNDRGSEVLFTLFQHPPMTDAELDRDTDVVMADLRRLKAVIEAQ